MLGIICYPFFNPVNTPGTNATAVPIGSPDAVTGGTQQFRIKNYDARHVLTFRDNRPR